MQVCTIACGQTVPTTSGRPLRPWQTTKNTAVTPTRQHANPDLPPPPAGAGPQPENVAFPGQGDPDGRVEGPVGDLTVADLHHYRVDEDRSVGLIQRSYGPVVHLLDHLVGDPADRLLGHRRPIDLGEVRRNLPSRQTLGITRQHDLINPGQPPLAR